MSSGIPVVYGAPAEQLSIPFSFLGDEMKSFKGARSVVRSVASSSGSASANSSILFNIPTGGYSYLKSNSVYIRATLVVEQDASASWGFAGQGVSDDQNFGGASSLINRISINIGGQTLTYGQYSTFCNSVLPHVTSAEYYNTDMKQSSFNGVMKWNSTPSSEAKRTIHFALPLAVPLFCASQNLPLFLLNSPMSVEILTESVGRALYSNTAGKPVTNYTLRDVSLVYETVEISNEYKQAMLQSKAGQMFSVHLNNYMSVGPNASTVTMTQQIGAQFSSLKSVLFTECLANPASTDRKVCSSNGLIRYTIFQDNFPVSCSNADNDAVTYLELNRAIGKINDSNLTSNIYPVANVAETSSRTSYCSHNFLAGASTSVLSDWSFSQQGTECSSITLQIEHGTPDANKWQSATAHSTNYSVYTFLLHDSVLAINVSDGTTMLRN